MHSEKASARQFECDQCAEKFHRKTHLKKHLFVVHTGNYRHNCEKCGKGYLLESQLKRHMKTSHKTHTCELCSQTFEKWTLFLAHKQREHTSTELKCSICDKNFNSRRGLNQHRVTHADERNQIQCKFDGCQKVFDRNSNMMAHFKRKHENRKFECSLDGCNLQLSTKQKLEQHIQVIHLGEMGQKKQKTKSKSEIAQRKDAGVQKTSTASKLFQVILPPEFERAIIAGHGKDIHIEYDRGIDDDDDEADDEEEEKEKEMECAEAAENVEGNEGQNDSDKFMGLAVINTTVDQRNSTALKC